MNCFSPNTWSLHHLLGVLQCFCAVVAMMWRFYSRLWLLELVWREEDEEVMINGVEGEGGEGNLWGSCEDESSWFWLGRGEEIAQDEKVSSSILTLTYAGLDCSSSSSSFEKFLSNLRSFSVFTSSSSSKPPHSSCNANSKLLFSPIKPQFLTLKHTNGVLTKGAIKNSFNKLTYQFPLPSRASAPTLQC